VYENKVKLKRDFTVSPAIKADRLELRASLDYQACDDQICYAPVQVPLTFTLAVEPLERQRVPVEIQRKFP